MTKREFLEMLNNQTSLLPEAERDRLLEYYGEIIDDRMEEGLSEADNMPLVNASQAHLIVLCFANTAYFTY